MNTHNPVAIVGYLLVIGIPAALVFERVGEAAGPAAGAAASGAFVGAAAGVIVTRSWSRFDWDAFAAETRAWRRVLVLGATAGALGGLAGFLAPVELLTIPGPDRVGPSLAPQLQRPIDDPPALPLRVLLGADVAAVAAVLGPARAYIRSDPLYGLRESPYPDDS